MNRPHARATSEQLHAPKIVQLAPRRTRIERRALKARALEAVRNAGELYVGDLLVLTYHLGVRHSRAAGVLRALERDGSLISELKPSPNSGLGRRYFRLAPALVVSLLAMLFGGCSLVSDFDAYRFDIEGDAGDAAQVLVDASDGATLPELDAGHDAADIEGDAGDAAQVLDVDASDGAALPELDGGHDAGNEQCCYTWACHPGCGAYWCRGRCSTFPCVCP